MPNWWTRAAFDRPAPFVVVLFAYCGGILVSARFRIAPEFAFSTGIGCLVLAWGVRRRPGTFAITLLLAILSAGITWHHLCWNFFHRNDIAFCAPGPAVLQGTVDTTPYLVPPEHPRDIGTTRFRIRPSQIQGTGWSSTSGSLWVNTHGQLIGVESGERVQLAGVLRPIRAPLNPGERDRRSFHRANRELLQMYVPHPSCVSIIGAGRHPKYWLTHFRAWCVATLRQYLSPNAASMASALLLGQRGSLPVATQDAFFKTGTFHLLAVSGLHVGIVASFGFLFMHLGFVPWKPGTSCVMLCVIGFAFLAGGKSPVMRAALLVEIVCLGWLIFRRTSPFNGLSIAGLAILIRNPTELFQTGTQLSFVAVAVLCSSLFGASLMRLSDRAPSDPLDRLIWNRRTVAQRLTRTALVGAARIVQTNITIWLATLPLVIQAFHLVCPLSIVLSSVLWLFVATGLYAAIGILIFHVTFPPLAIVSASLCNHVLNGQWQIVRFASQMPGSHFWVCGPGKTWTVAFYAALLILIACPRCRSSNPAWLLCVTVFAVWFVTATCLSQSWNHNQLRCTFVSVGHGSCVLIEFPDGYRMLYDAGTLGHRNAGLESVSRVLWARRIRTLDAILISHVDADHFNLVADLVDRFRVKSIYTSSYGNRDRPEFQRLRSVSARHNVGWIEVNAGSELQHGASRVRVLHPLEPHESEAPKPAMNDNAASLVLQIDYLGYSILLPGDIERDGLQRLMSKLRLDADVVMAPHHGSRHSKPLEFAKWCTPEWLIISSGKSELVEEYRTLARQRRCQVFNTSLHGAVEALVDSSGLHVSSFRRPTSRAFEPPGQP